MAGDVEVVQQHCPLALQLKKALPSLKQTAVLWSATAAVVALALAHNNTVSGSGGWHGQQTTL
jgi:hypothetical protein